MTYLNSFVICALTLLTWIDEVPSGPETGTKLEPLNVVVAVGDRVGEAIDVTKVQPDKPTIYLFVRAEQWDRPMARVIKGVDEALAHGADGLKDAGVVAVWITDTPEKSRDYLPLAQQSLQLKQTRWTVFEGGKNGPEKWVLNDAAGLTVVVARNGKVVKSTGYTSWNETDVRQILRALNAS